MTYMASGEIRNTDEIQREEVCGFVDRLRSSRKFCNHLFHRLLMLAGLSQCVEGHDVEVGLRVGLVTDVTTKN